MELFADMKSNSEHHSESDHTISVKEHDPWKVLLVDDDPQMHQITQLALGNFSFQKRPLQLISAYSGEEAKIIFQQERNIALALIDVIPLDLKKSRSGRRIIP